MRFHHPRKSPRPPLNLKKGKCKFEKPRQKEEKSELMRWNCLFEIHKHNLYYKLECVSFAIRDKLPDTSKLKEERFFEAHSFRAFCPCSKAEIWQKDMAEKSFASHYIMKKKQAGGRTTARYLAFKNTFPMTHFLYLSFDSSSIFKFEHQCLNPRLL